jgi:hypothetical protein
VRRKGDLCLSCEVEVGVIRKVEVTGWSSGDFFFLPTVVAVSKVKAVGFAPAFGVEGGCDGVVLSGSVVPIVDGDGVGIGFDFVVDAIGHDVYLIENCLEIALNIMLAIVT